MIRFDSISKMQLLIIYQKKNVGDNKMINTTSLCQPKSFGYVILDFHNPFVICLEKVQDTSTGNKT